MLSLCGSQTTTTDSIRTEMARRLLWIALGCVSLFAFGQASAATLASKVVGVSDGDTFTVLNAHHQQFKIRLETTPSLEVRSQICWLGGSFRARHARPRQMRGEFRTGASLRPHGVMTRDQERTWINDHLLLCALQKVGEDKVPRYPA